MWVELKCCITSKLFNNEVYLKKVGQNKLKQIVSLSQSRSAGHIYKIHGIIFNIVTMCRDTVEKKIMLIDGLPIEL